MPFRLVDRGASVEVAVREGKGEPNRGKVFGRIYEWGRPDWRHRRPLMLVPWASPAVLALDSHRLGTLLCNQMVYQLIG